MTSRVEITEHPDGLNEIRLTIYGERYLLRFGGKDALFIALGRFRLRLMKPWEN